MYNVRSDRSLAWMKANHILDEAAEAYGCEQSFLQTSDDERDLSLLLNHTVSMAVQ